MGYKFIDIFSPAFTVCIVFSCYNSIILNSYAETAVVAEEKRDYVLRNLRPLRFGKLVAAERGVSAMTIDAATGAKRPGAGVTELGGDFGTAEFEIIGRPGDAFTVHVPETVKADGKAGSIRNMHVRPKGVITLGRDGRAVFEVGGTLRLAPRYSGPVTAAFAVTIDKALE